MTGSTVPSAARPAAMRPAKLSDVIYVYAFPRWKWRFVRRCFAGHTLRFLSKGAKLPRDGALLLWGMAPAPEGLSNDVPIIRMEDGFLRSVGLGAELTRPLSWVVDARGIYYDATQASDLEYLLEFGPFSPDLIARAKALRERVLAAGLTKYNLSGRRWQRPSGGQQVILVPGQVESDASLTFGAPEIRTNMGLLREVRDAHARLIPVIQATSGCRRPAAPRGT